MDMRALLEPKKHGKARSKAGSADGECVLSLFLRFNASASAKGILHRHEARTVANLRNEHLRAALFAADATTLSRILRLNILFTSPPRVPFPKRSVHVTCAGFGSSSA